MQKITFSQGGGTDLQKKYLTPGLIILIIVYQTKYGWNAKI